MRHELVAALIRYFLGRAGYSGKVRVFTRRETFERAARGRHVSLTEGERGSMAMTVHGRVPLVWVDPAKHTTIAQLSDSAAHESVHVALGVEFPHGRAFDRRVRRLLRGGVM